MGAFAKKAAAVLDWRDRMAQQQERFRKVLPSSEEEASARALMSAREMRDKAYTMGYMLRAMHQRHGMEDLLKTIEPLGTGREMLVDIPAFKQASWIEPALWSSMALELFGKQAATALGGEDNSKLEVDPKELKKGIEVEKEHTPDPKLAEQIARDHLKEIPDYYSRLKKMEAGAKKDEGEKKAGILGAMVEPIRYGAQDVKATLARKADEKIQEGLRPTTDPGTLPWFYPSLAFALPHAVASGYRSAEDEYNAKLKAQMDAKVQAAKKEFEEALQSEYEGGRKAASAGEMLDALAQGHIKAAAGELGQAAGVYGALAALLGQGGYYAGRSLAEKRDPRYLQAKAMAEMARQRLRSRPIPVLIGDPETTLDRAEGIEVPVGEQEPESAT